MKKGNCKLDGITSSKVDQRFSQAIDGVRIHNKMDSSSQASFRGLVFLIEFWTSIQKHINLMDNSGFYSGTYFFFAFLFAKKYSSSRRFSNNPNFSAILSNSPHLQYTLVIRPLNFCHLITLTIFSKSILFLFFGLFAPCGSGLYIRRFGIRVTSILGLAK